METAPRAKADTGVQLMSSLIKTVKQATGGNTDKLKEIGKDLTKHYQEACRDFNMQKQLLDATIESDRAGFAKQIVKTEYSSLHFH